jgi:hypothetical protein
VDENGTVDESTLPGAPPNSHLLDSLGPRSGLNEVAPLGETRPSRLQTHLLQRRWLAQAPGPVQPGVRAPCSRRSPADDPLPRSPAHLRLPGLASRDQRQDRVVEARARQRGLHPERLLPRHPGDGRGRCRGVLRLHARAGGGGDHRLTCATSHTSSAQAPIGGLAMRGAETERPSQRRPPVRAKSPGRPQGSY